MSTLRSAPIFLISSVSPAPRVCQQSEGQKAKLSRQTSGHHPAQRERESQSQRAERRPSILPLSHTPEHSLTEKRETSKDGRRNKVAASRPTRLDSTLAAFAWGCKIIFSPGSRFIWWAKTQSQRVGRATPEVRKWPSDGRGRREKLVGGDARAECRHNRGWKRSFPNVLDDGHHILRASERAVRTWPSER